MSSLPQPVHQQVKLQVNPRKRLWKGTTTVRVIAAPGQQTVGLHCYNLTIHQVSLNGIPTEYTLHQYAAEALPELTIEQLQKGSGKDAEISSASEYAYDQYIRLMHKEQDPELLIQIPAAVQQRNGTAEATAAEVPGTAGTAGTPAATATATTTPLKAAGEAAKSSSAATAAQQDAAGPKREPSAPAGSAGTISGSSPAAATPASKPQQPEATNQQQPQHLSITITFSKPASSIGKDASLLLSDNCLVANPQLRRARGWFPCLDAPLYIYTAGAPHCMPYTFDLQLTVPASFMAVCSGILVQQTCKVMPVQHGNTPVAAAGSNGATGSQDAASTVVVARTFQYSVTTPVVPSHISIAVGPLVAVQYSDLLAAGGTPAAASTSGLPVITVFAPISTDAAPAMLAQANRVNGTNRHSNNGSTDDSNGSTSALKGLSSAYLRRLAHTLKPLSVLLRAYEKVLSCMFPWSHLQVAVLPDGSLMKQWQAGLGSILLQESCLVTDNLVLEPRLASASCLAAALAQQYFGLLLLPKGPEDIWLLKGLGGWLEGQGIKQLAGSNELLYRRWQERLWLCALDDGEQLGPLSPQVKEGDRGFTAAWGRLHGTQDLDPFPALVWKATAVMHMLERKIGEDELRKVLERYVNGAKHAAANTASSQQPSSFTPAVPGTPPPAAVPTTSATTAGGTAVAAVPSAVPATAAVAALAAAGVGAASSGIAERLMTTAKFMKTMSKKQGFKKEAPGFFNRWVHGTGIPHLSAGVSWDSKRSLLLLALRQSGSKAVMRGALRASEPVVLGGENTGGAAPGGRACTLKLLVRELDACEEHPLQVDAATPLSLHDIKVSSKLGAQRRRMQAAAAAGARRGNSSWLGGAADDLDVSEAELRGVPVLWVQLDHGMEWLTAVKLQQPAHWWALQLEHSKDVVAQAQSVAGLAQQFGGPSSSPQQDKYIIGVLGAAMRNPGVFCRVRLDAALALGAAAGKYQNNDAAVELFKFVRERLYDGYTGLMLPNDFSDLGEALINHGLPAALAKITMLGGYTPESILAQLLELLTCSDSSSNTIDDGHWLAALVTALGQLRLSNAAELAKVLKEIDRMLSHEAVVGTHNAVLGCACLRAATQLATQVQHAAAAALLEQVKQLLMRYVREDDQTTAAAAVKSSSSSGRRLKATAYGCLLQVAAAASEAELRGMMAGLEAAAAAAAAAAAGNGDVSMGEQQQQQVQQMAYTASYSHLLQHLLTLTATTDVQPPLLLDTVLKQAVELLDGELDPVLRAEIMKEALLLIGQLEQQGYYVLKPDALLSDSFRAAAVAEAAAAAAASSGDVVMAELAAADGQETAAAAAAEAVEPTAAAAAAAPPAEGTAAAAAPAVATDLGAVPGTDAATTAAAVLPPQQQQRRQQKRPSIVPLSVDVLLRVQQLLNDYDEPVVRQLAFMMLQRLAGHPATLHRERDEDDDDLITAAAAATTAVTAGGHTAGRGGNAAGAASGGAAPSGSMRTGMTGGRAKSNMPAVSAGGVSVQHTGTTAPTKIRLSGVKLSLKKPPAAAAGGGGGGGSTASAAAAGGNTGSAGTAPNAAPAAAAAGSDAVPGSSPGTAMAAADAGDQKQGKTDGVTAAQTPSSAVSPFAAANQQQQQQHGKVDNASAAGAAVTAPSNQQQQQQQQHVPVTVPLVAASVAPLGAAAAAVGTSAAPPAAAAATAPSTAASSAVAAPIRVRPLVKASKLPGSTGNLMGQQVAPAAAAAAACSGGGGAVAVGTSSGVRTSSPSPGPAAVPQQQQQQQLSGVKRSAAAAAAAHDVTAQAAATPAAAAAPGAGPPLKKPKFKKNGFPGQLAAAAAAAQPAAAVAAPPAAAVTAAVAGGVQAPIAGAPSAAAAAAAAPSVSGVTASGVSGAPRKLKFKLPTKKG